MSDSPTIVGWFLSKAVEPDGVRILQHHFRKPDVSQFFLSTRPDVAPVQFLRSVKGRLQYIVRTAHPRAFHRNYAFRSVGATDHNTIQQYIASQVNHHPMADPRVTDVLHRLQFHDSNVDLSAVRSNSYGQYWYNLHVVLCNNGRWREIDEQTLQAIRTRILGVAKKYGYLISRCAILTDHIHFELGCTPETAPADLALRYMNNIVHLAGMRPLLEFSYYVGTVGEYTRNACVG